MSGVPAAIHQAFALVRVGGRVQMLGIPAKPIDVDFATEIIFKGLTIYGVVGRRMYDTWLLMTRFLRSGQFDPTPVITHRFPLEGVRRGDSRHQVRRGGQGHLRDRITDDGVSARGTELRHSPDRSKTTIEQLKGDKVYKRLNYLDSPQSAHVQMEGRGDVLILSSNNYLGLSDEPSVIDAGIDGLRTLRRRHGERAVHLRHVHDPSRARSRRSRDSSAREASLSFVAAWNANEAFTGDDRAGRRLHRLRRAQPRVDHRLDAAGEGDHQVHDRRLQARRHGRPARQARREQRARSAASSGPTACSRWKARSRKLPDILQIARDTDAIVVVDDSHATGVLGKTGRGTAEHFGVLGEVDVITSTLGKALGGAAGGFVAGSAALCDYLTQRARPQLFSNALPTDRGGERDAAVRVRRAASGARRRRCATTRRTSASRSPRRGSSRSPGETPIIPIIVGETAAAIQMSDMLLDEGVFVTGFGFPVVPQGQARVRCQISAAHTRDDLDQAIAAFKKVGARLGIVR